MRGLRLFIFDGERGPASRRRRPMVPGQAWYWFSVAGARAVTGVSSKTVLCLSKLMLLSRELKSRLGIRRYAVNIGECSRSVNFGNSLIRQL